ncbi:MAG: thioredoxin family protein [Bacteroidaceae bacterium]|nr:thioredoxin family protein [Bacteroidaceae bacterium]
MRKALSALLFIMFAFTVSAQVRVTVSKKAVAGHNDLIDIVFSGNMDAGWHVYGPDNTGGPTPLSFNTDKLSGAKAEGGLKLGGSLIKKMDDMFGCEVTFFEQTFSATQRLRLTGGAWEVAGYLQYGACNDMSCLPPTPVEFSFNGTYEAKAEKPVADKAPAATPESTSPTKEKNQASEETETDAAQPLAAVTPSDSTSQAEADTNISAMSASDLWQPVTDELKALSDVKNESSRSLFTIFLLGLVGGLLALIMPCIWPIIPMTVSFFLKRAKDDKRRGIRDAVIYGLSIVVIFVGLGLLITLIWGPSKLNELSTNAIFNIFLFLLLVAFAASFLGGFEMTLPSSWSNKMDAKASSTTGVISIFFMAFTLVLVSFSCTAPIVGLLLVEMATSGNIIAPTVGMLGFSIALAAPFTLFALFPAWLKSAPKSGNWMNVVKVVLGLVELAFALKFLSVADLAYGWRILDRETFLCLWIMIFAFMGFYLLGWIRLPHDEDEYDDEGNVIQRPRIGVTRFLTALVSLAFALYMVPGLWGAPCKAVSAFAPPMWTQDFRLDESSVEATFTNYEEGMEAARKAGKPVMLDFTGFGCVNCRKMEAAVWPDAQVRQLMTEDYVLISLYVDDKTPLDKPAEVTESDGTTRRLRTIGDKWSYLQRRKFGAQTQPFYVLLDKEGKPLAPAYSYDEDVSKFVKWLRDGINKFNDKQQ